MAEVQDLTESLIDKEDTQEAGQYRMMEDHENERMQSDWGWKAVFLVNVFLACVSFSIVLPSLWPYLQTVNPLPSYL